MIDFCRRQATTKQGQIKISLLFSVIFICFAVIGMTVFAQPYAVYATGEKVADPWVVSVDGTPVVGFETTRYVTSEEEIEYDTVELEDDEFAQGETQVTQEGVNGKKEITSLETLVNGEVVATETVEENVTVEPVSKVVVTGTKEPEPEPEPEPEATATSSGSSSSSSSSSGGSGGHAAAGGGLSTAYAMIGVPYVWGGTSTSGVDCSGLVNVCYGGARGRTTYAMIGSLQSTGDWKTSMSELNVGDLVFPHSGHVGIYIGDGMMIHAPSPGRSVCIAPVYSFYGGGPY